MNDQMKKYEKKRCESIASVWRTGTYLAALPTSLSGDILEKQAEKYCF